MRLALETDTGLLRTSNQDHSFAAPIGPSKAWHLLAVADGMGGHEGGEVASSIAIASLVEHVSRELEPGADLPAVLRHAFRAANEAVLSAGRRTEQPGMGTTLSAALVDGLTAYVGHVGDSRVYLWRRGCLKALTADHSVVAELVRDGRISRPEAAHHPERHVLTRALGFEGLVAADVTSWPLRPGDRLLLCTDGLTRVVLDGEIEAIMAGPDLPTAASNLVQLANERGGPDNVTVVIGELGGEAV